MDKATPTPQESSCNPGKFYLTCAQTAKLVRKALKETFPGTSFSIRSKVYSGGASITVSYSDGPCLLLVEKIAKEFEGATFDGMVDLKSYSQHYLLPDGSVKLASYYPDGTSGPVGIVQALPEGSRLCAMGADFIFVNRESSTPCHESRHACRVAMDPPAFAVVA